MKKFIMITIWCILICVSLNALCEGVAVQTIQFMDSGENVEKLKSTLADIGYLDKSYAINQLYGRETKDAVMELQKDFGLKQDGIASPEIQVICDLLLRLQESSTIAQPEKQASLLMPDVVGIEEQDAIDIIKKMQLYPLIEKDYNDTVMEGRVISTSPANGKEVAENQKVTVHVSKGPSIIYATDATWYAWWVKGSKKDHYELESPHIEEGYLYIELDATLNSSYKLRWRGFGTAAINDTFDKVVPLSYTYKNEEIKKGEAQHIVLKIPIEDLNVQKPTTLSVKIELYRNKDTEVTIRMDFTMAWQ